MTRLPFEFDEPAESSPTRKKAERESPWTVAELAGRIKGVLTDHLPRRVRVVGEVSNLSDRNHWFFSLKDASASIRSVMFASAARKIGFPVRDGIEVVATGRIDFYDAQGSVQLYVDRLEPVGEGVRELALRAMIKELRELGYFAPEHKKPIPGVPRKIAVVTSRSAAALQDVINTAGQRWAGCELVLVDVRVQGDDAAPQIAAALRRLSRDGNQLGIDAILLTRGGGSIEDLWAFNERVVADAVYDCVIPIVAAIGHETDTTVAELVADLRCATPTQAAMTLVPDRVVLDQQVDQLARRMRLALQRHAEVARHRLDAAARHALFQRPERLVETARQRVDRLEQQLVTVLPRRVADERKRLDAMARTLDAVSPSNVLKRGYSYTLGGDGKLLRSVSDTAPGSALTTVLADGRVASTVDGGDSDAPPVLQAPRNPRRSRPMKDTDGQPTLFA
ncbi:MAG: exodeoxyribonuclease VII large subunit [Planctomycetota bacterium]